MQHDEVLRAILAVIIVQDSVPVALVINDGI